MTYELSIDGPTFVEDYPEERRSEIMALREQGHRQIVVGGYVDAVPSGYHGCAWLFNIAEGEAEGWSLNREVVLYRHQGVNVEVELPTARFDRWADVAAALPDLIVELLATPLPTLHDQ